ncbi:unnamed protein product, partial [Mesorhabditis belari]|uniref:Bacterial surface antigen (D15) domain-containing protein n=1 Tax=Mesorhabditis belari TaxID=2138241 RepID=A0AAF3FMR5_9BILA
MVEKEKVIFCLPEVYRNDFIFDQLIGLINESCDCQTASRTPTIKMREPTKTYHRADVLWGKANQTPSIVEAVQFHGINITKNDALIKEVAELYRSNNLDQLVHDSNCAAKHLQEVGLMENATALIDTAQSKEGYIVNFVVKEPKPFTFGVKAGMSTQGDADLSLNAAKQSCFGRGESINASYSNTIKGDHSFNLNFIKPFLGWQKYSNFTMSLYRSMAHLPWNQSNLDENAVILQYNGQLFNKKLLHSLKMNSIWRTLRVTDDAAFAVREFSGHTMKFSFENSVAYDTRDRPLLATRGLLGRWSQEYAGPLGDHHFLKNQLDFQASTLLFKDVILALSLQVKSVNSLGSKELHLLERAYLGGNQDLRGFGLNTVGVRADNSCLGGGAALAGVFHLYKPLFPPQMLYAHAWIAGGSIASVRSKSAIKDMLEAQRSTAGIGLTFVFKNIFRLELNYVHPIQTVPGDSFTRGLHIGAGVNFI